MTVALAITADSLVMPEVLRLATQAGAEASEPEPLKLDGALNAGVTLEDIKTGAEVLALLFKVGSGALVFLGALRDYLRDKGSSVTVAVADAATGAMRGRLGAQTTANEIAVLAGQTPAIPPVGLG